MGFSSSPRLLTAVRTAVCLALMGIASYALAEGQPLVLDSQTGVHDGQSGLVLQNAPFSRAPMVPAQQLPTPTELDSTSGQPPIVVAPYIAAKRRAIPP
ncbi:MAG: hypothetical protein KGQ57_08980 [Burkholderiales bacterium]|nr:hypothetical protein [Burkholderiales bacterium]